MTILTPRLDRYETNLAMNGGLDIWQRSLGSTNVGSTDVFFADRWLFSPFNSTGRFTVAQVADVPTFTQAGAVLPWSYKITTTTVNGAGNQTTVLRYTLEGQDIASFFGRNFRQQFFVKTSLSGTYCVEFTNYNNTGANVRSYITTYTIAAGQVNTWVPVVIDLPMDTINSVWSFDNTLGLRVHWHLQPAANQSSTLNQWFSPGVTAVSSTTQASLASTNGATWQIAGMAIIPNDLTGIAGQLLAFKRAGMNFQQELALCQRYCETSYDATVPFFLSNGNQNAGASSSPTYWNAANSGGALVPVIFKVPKRAAPVGGTSFRVYAQNSGTIDSVRDESSLTDRAVVYTGNGSRINTTGANVLSSATPSGDFIEFNWIASSEL